MSETEIPQRIEAVVGVFDDPAKAAWAANELQRKALDLHRVSRTDPTAEQAMPEIQYDSVQDVDEDDIFRGALKGGAIGAGSGLLFIGVPGLNVAAPIAGALAGAFIGAVAGIDEALRGVRLPDPIDYSALLAAGKSIIVIAGSESERLKLAIELAKLGANEVYQHPPVLEGAFHKPHQ